jgi:hypothetical protein
MSVSLTPIVLISLGDILDFGSSPLVGWLGISGTAIAIFLAFVFYRRSKRFKRPAYVVTTWNLIQDYSAKLQGLKIEFKGKSLASISVSKIVVWNDGNETIHGSDIAQADPLRVVVTGADLVDVIVLMTTHVANQFKITPIGNDVSIVFDYLDRNQGGILQLVHTGKSSENIAVRGSIKGALSTVRRTFDPPGHSHMPNSSLHLSSVLALLSS